MKKAFWNFLAVVCLALGFIIFLENIFSNVPIDYGRIAFYAALAALNCVNADRTN